MALSHLLQPKLNLPILRFSQTANSHFIGVSTRFYTSKRSIGDSENSQPLKNEAGVTPVIEHLKETSEEKKGFFSKATSVLGFVARYVGSTSSERPSAQFTEHKGHQTETKAENEGRKAESGDNQNVRFEGAEMSSQSESCPTLTAVSSGSALEIDNDSDNQTETTAENEGRKAESALSDDQNVRCEGVEESFESYESALEIDKQNNSMEVSGLFTKHKDKQIKTTTENEGRKAESGLSDDQNEICEAVKRPLQSNTSPHVLDLIKAASDGLAMEIDDANLQRSDDDDDVLNLLEFLDRSSSKEEKKTNRSGNEAFDLKELKTCFKVPKFNEDQRHRQNTCPATTESVENRSESVENGTESVENRVLVRFLDSNSTEIHIRQCFDGCGEILKIEFPSLQGPLFKAAYIDFKTEEGFEKALKKSGSLINSAAIIVDPATAMEKDVELPIPGLLGDPDVPSALIKNPTKTIKIEKLTKATTSHHIAEALAFCKSNISGYTLGSSHSVAYVEFESEMGKERALAKQSIDVLGRQLVILRIDCPRTTVVRISTMDDHLKMREIRSICKSLGDFSISRQRCSNILDVHFKLAEWPNMVKILNGLNGRVVEGQRLQAEPATVFSPEVLSALWHNQEERKCLEATRKALLHKLPGFDTSELVSLENEFLCKI